MNKWDKIFESDPQYKPLNEIFLSKLLEKIKTEVGQEPKTMVDLGCGTARTIFQFAERGFNVTGIDFSKIALKKLQQKIDESNFQNIILIDNDLDNITIRLNADIFLCNFVYSFINNKKVFLRKISEFMIDTSVFILITPVTYKYINYIESDKPSIAVDYEETLDILKSIFSSVEDYHHDYISIREDYVTFLVKKIVKI